MRLDGADLVVACDGVNSRLRRRHQDRLETSVVVGSNPYVWLGTSKVFEAFTFAFTRTPAGWIWFHAYAFNGEASTFIVECTSQTWAGLGFDRLGVDDSLRLLERIFERHLEGHRLLVHSRDDRTLPWLRFRSVSNGRWHHGNLVLMGDAAHTTHFTIGSGTELAVEDAITLAERLDEHADLPTALEAYGTQRRADLALPQRTRPTAPSGSSTSRAMSACTLPSSRRCSGSDVRVCSRTFLRSCTTASTGRPGRSGCGAGSGSWPVPGGQPAMSAAESDHRSAGPGQLPGWPKPRPRCPCQRRPTRPDRSQRRRSTSRRPWP